LRSALAAAPAQASSIAGGDKPVSTVGLQPVDEITPGRAGRPLSVLLADDNRMFREALLGRVRQVVGEVEIREVFTAEDLFTACGASYGRTDLVLVDIGMAELRGCEGLRELRRLRPDAMVIAIGCPADPAEARTALELGVSAYLLKSMGSEAFIAALALVLNGERFFPASVMLDALKLASAQAPGSARPPEVAHATNEHLTPRQLAVLRHLAVGKSNKEIARALGIQEITVKVHLQAIFARIGVSNRTQAAMHAERAGWFVGLQDGETADSENGSNYSN
jgi:DNA-binding NarL/FixJ family response regulator